MRWDDRQCRVLSACYFEYGVDAMSERFGRSTKAVKLKANALGLRHFACTHWSEAEREVIAAGYAMRGTDVVDALPGRTREMIRAQAARMGIKRQTPNPGQFKRRGKA